MCYQEKNHLIYDCITIHKLLYFLESFKQSGGRLFFNGYCLFEEFDFETGRLLDVLDELGLSKNTLVIYTSDNGPWNQDKYTKNKKGHPKDSIFWGDSGPLRNGKGSCYEGGYRLPCIVRWPGKVPAGQESGAIFTSVDFMSTFANLCDFEVPKDRRIDGIEKPRMIPNERVVGKGLLKVVSTGMLVEDEGTALMWRGLMLTKAVEQFLNDVHWGHLDYLLIDMPPGTGDVQMGLARMLPRTDLVIVTTPAVSAQKVAIRAADMAQRSFLRVAGVIENMTSFECDHGNSYALFGTGGGTALANETGAELLGQVPIEATVALGGDTGEPVALHNTGKAAIEFHNIARKLIAQTIAQSEMSGCSARVEEVAVPVAVRSRT